jgi:chromosome segregation ATPase
MPKIHEHIKELTQERDRALAEVERLKTEITEHLDSWERALRSRDTALAETRTLRARAEELEMELDTHGLKRQRDDARVYACKLLYIAECRGPKVFGPRPPWLEPNPCPEMEAE